MKISIVTTEHCFELLQPLITAYQSKQYHVDWQDSGEALPAPSTLREMAQSSDAILLVGPGRRAPGTVLPGPVIRAGADRTIPVGWVPHLNDKSLAVFSHKTAAIHQRQIKYPESIAVLSQWQPRYLQLARRIEDILQQQHTAVYRWTSDMMFREDMIKGLGTGLAAAIYVGHGRPNGWVGYRGTRAQHFDSPASEPLGALFSLCCRTASRRRTGVSFAEKIILSGVAGAVFGSVTDTLHRDNTRWAIRLIQALAENITTVGELITHALPINDDAISDYRIIGDPLSPLVSATSANESASKIPVYP
ncbi:MAG: hypothetical protein KZQ85_17255 [Candidatus Thiodiazotropha sp. (ex Myrtea sp. 'scaly one' KF741663)]|nr:hypothetical protein [Candidatus Thiodiazotropha sp. (ex Myrtea sp. 'scaly one' KF741663)]